MTEDTGIAAAWEAEREAEAEWERVVVRGDVPEVSQAWVEETGLESSVLSAPEASAPKEVSQAWVEETEHESNWESSVLSAPVVASAPAVAEASAPKQASPPAPELAPLEPVAKPPTSFLPARSQSREAYVSLPSQELRARERAKIAKRKAELRAHLEQQCKVYDEYVPKLAQEHAAKRSEIKQRLDQQRSLQRERAAVFKQATEQRIAQFRIEEEHRQRELAEKRVEVKTRITLLDSARKERSKPEALKAMF